MRDTNLLIVMVDEMSATAVGCYGHPTVRTPRIDELAARGVRFRDAYATTPICMPARAVVATGRYAHETGYWDNVLAYDGRVKGWGHRLQQHGHRNTSIGKLHYIDGEAPTGIDEQILPMHVFAGGDVFGLERENQPKRPQNGGLAAEVALGHSGYTRYDERISALTEEWFSRRLDDQGNKPWVLFTSFIAPHFPLTVPEEYVDLYRDADIELPGKTLNDQGPVGAWWQQFRDGYNFDDYFDGDDHRRKALIHYLALCSFADRNVGRVVAALDSSGAADNTRILFVADHGDNLGARGLWGKSTMYRESVNVPLILAGPDIPAGRICSTPVSLVDIYPTVMQSVGIAPGEADRMLPGKSLLEIAVAPDDPDREVFCEYHASCAPTAVFMIRRGRFKYIHYTGAGAELFDLQADPDEIDNLADNPEFTGVISEFETRLREIVDPEEADRRAKADQSSKLDELGGLEAVLARGGVPHTPAPGEEPQFV